MRQWILSLKRWWVNYSEDEAVFKVSSVKRKSNLGEIVTTSKKMAQDETLTKSSGEVSNASDLSGSESEQEFSEVQVEEEMRQDYIGYSLERMKNFLQPENEDHSQ